MQLDLNLIWIQIQLKKNKTQIDAQNIANMFHHFYHLWLKWWKKIYFFWINTYSKRHISIPFKEIFLIWNYAKNDLWNLKMFSLNQFWWIVIIWINSLHNNNNNYCYYYYHHLSFVCGTNQCWAIIGNKKWSSNIYQGISHDS
jgi:hypothetical protein